MRQKFRILKEEMPSQQNPYPMIELECLECGYTFWVIPQRLDVALTITMTPNGTHGIVCFECERLEELKKKLHVVFFADNTVR